MGVLKKALIEINGYDEDFTGVAADDNDLVDRLVAAQNDYIYVDTDVVHLFHGHKNLEVMKSEAYQHNVRLWKERRGKIVRNPGKDMGVTSIETFWDSQHDANAQLYLSGYVAKELFKHLRLQNVEFDNFLEIGVGMGYTLRELSKTKSVYACDISKVGLAKLNDVLEDSWLDVKLLPSDKFDLIASLCVAQHIPDYELFNHVHHAVRALTADGVFAMQFAFQTEGVVTSQGIANQITGGICRNYDDVVKLVEEAGGKIVYSEQTELFPQFHSGWYVLHIKKPS